MSLSCIGSMRFLNNAMDIGATLNGIYWYLLALVNCIRDYESNQMTVLKWSLDQLHQALNIKHVEELTSMTNVSEVYKALGNNGIKGSDSLALEIIEINWVQLFGLSPAFYIFKNVLHPFTQFWRGEGIIAVIYFDNGSIPKFWI